jgi:hypothetical protein
MKISLWILLYAVALTSLPFTAAAGPTLRGGEDDGVDGLVRDLKKDDKVKICRRDGNKYYTIYEEKKKANQLLKNKDKYRKGACCGNGFPCSDGKKCETVKNVKKCRK